MVMMMMMMMMPLLLGSTIRISDIGLTFCVLPHGTWKKVGCNTFQNNLRDLIRNPCPDWGNTLNVSFVDTSCLRSFVNLKQEFLKKVMLFSKMEVL